MEPRYLEFVLAELEEVTAEMDTLAAAHAGWINFEPAVAADPEDLPPPPSALFGVFSGKGPDVPLGTWTPPSAPSRRGRVEPAMLGLQHGAGTRAKPRLADLGYGVPEPWRVVQDHSRKGLVVAVPATVGHADALTWLLRAAAALTAVALTGTWRASVYSP